MRDDGRGFPDRIPSGEWAELLENELPKSLLARARQLGGRLRAWNSLSGAILRVELPL
jgi:signal transduction histidine kinase